MPEWLYAAGLAVNTIGLLIVVFKLVWGSGTELQSRFSLIEKLCADGVTAVRNEFLAKLELQSSNIGNVTANISDRIHGLELKAMEARAIAAETYMRRDSYHKATDEFKRDVQEAHRDLKTEMHAGFAELKEQVGAVSMSIEENRRSAAERTGPRAQTPR